MFRRWLLAYLGQPKQEPTQYAIMERMDVLERGIKRQRDENDGVLDELKHAVQTTRALNARMTRLLETREKAVQDAPGLTIAPQDGVQGLPAAAQPGEDLWQLAARVRASKRAESAQAKAG